jgi:hypothetical protein
MCLAEYHHVFLNIVCSHFLVFVRKLFLCEEKSLSGYMDVTGQQYNLLKPTGYGMHQQVECFNNCMFCPHCIYVFCICLKQTATCAFYIKNWLVFITEMKSVYCAVWTGLLSEAVCALSFKG